MPRQTVISRKKRGPPPTGKGTPVMVRVQPDLMKRLDDWSRAQKDEPSRPEAIRRLVEQALKNNQPVRAGPHKGAAKAMAMAGKELDRRGDKSATDEERQRRKRRILQGPREFREIREDFPKRKR
jgi:metal-responsive CopG/Arc/MetJ family transcriptional regulator